MTPYGGVALPKQSVWYLVRENGVHFWASSCFKRLQDEEEPRKDTAGLHHIVIDIDSPDDAATRRFWSLHRPR